MNWLVDADVTEPEFVKGVEASGGTEDVVNIGGQLYRTHTFTENGTLSIVSGGQIEVMVVGGGGAGGSISSSTTTSNDYFLLSGGGGAGGFLITKLSVSTGESYSIEPASSSASDGNDSKIVKSSVDIVVAKGGQRGSTIFQIESISVLSGSRSTYPGASAGGGSCGANNGFGGGVGGEGLSFIFGQGNESSASVSSSNFSFNSRSGGGGGALSKAVDMVFRVIPDATPDGGQSITSDFSGITKNYSGGGGGASLLGSGGLGGAQSGGNGASLAFSTVAQNGQPNTGGGGGGAATNKALGDASTNGGLGASGIIIIRYPIEA